MKFILTLMAMTVRLAVASAQVDVTPDFEKEYRQAHEIYMLERVVLKAMIGTGFNRFEHPSVRGWFPVHQNNEYTVIFWEHSINPSVYATFHFDEDYDKIKFDTTKRPCNDYEAGICNMLYAAESDHAKDTAFRHLPNAREIFIPISTAYGNKVFCMSRAKEPKSYLFGNDVEYEFDRSYNLISKRVIHRKATQMCIDPLEDLAGKELSGFHPHFGEKVQDIPITDIASLYFYVDQKTWGAFSIVGEQDTYTFLAADMRVAKSPTKEVRKVNPHFSAYLKAVTILE